MKPLAVAVLLASALSATVVKLTPDEFVVKAGTMRYWKFGVPEAAGKVVGDFRASGGAHNDIRVVITDADECINYLDGNRANVYYDSGPKTVGHMDVAVNRGDYCIIFDNKNSIVSAKEVATHIELMPR